MTKIICTYREPKERPEIPKLPKKDYLQYEILKREYVYNNPSASPAEYAQAMRRIAKECGV